MINERTYFRAMDAAVLSLGFDPYDRDANNYTSFYWGLMTCAYLELVQPAVSHLPLRAAACVDKDLQSWAEGGIERKEDVTVRAQKQFEKWFKADFMGLWRKAAVKSRAMLTGALEEYVNKFLSSEGLPGVSLELFSLRDAIKHMEKNLREQVLPYMLDAICAYELPMLDDDAADRDALLRDNRDELKSRRDLLVGQHRTALADALVTEDTIFSFATAVIRELNGKLNALKCGSVSGGN